MRRSSTAAAGHAACLDRSESPRRPHGPPTRRGRLLLLCRTACCILWPPAYSNLAHSLSTSCHQAASSSSLMLRQPSVICRAFSSALRTPGVHGSALAPQGAARAQNLVPRLCTCHVRVLRRAMTARGSLGHARAAGSSASLQKHAKRDPLQARRSDDAPRSLQLDSGATLLARNSSEREDTERLMLPESHSCCIGHEPWCGGVASDSTVPSAHARHSLCRLPRPTSRRR
ncbi:hypothetical protein FA09DRAFT_330349 [Tilletiopsis washingtonensis]|uniref:Uncharacterized protein n=1 Tax=Tilletiopsis washingtonensis TaxID=58919 RepID=A0A316Z7Z2_9BASI|nr:hypothetical protein FA09DRAFT_330349 [Tilletiopsis washingtonensis]PWN97691.1 hypothetical protein FA09DRAFT_330349 [Tilletiopsis washingtonensis]